MPVVGPPFGGGVCPASFPPSVPTLFPEIKGLSVCVTHSGSARQHCGGSSRLLQGGPWLRGVCIGGGVHWGGGVEDAPGASLPIPPLRTVTQRHLIKPSRQRVPRGFYRGLAPPSLLPQPFSGVGVGDLDPPQGDFGEKKPLLSIFFLRNEPVGTRAAWGGSQPPSPEGWVERRRVGARFMFATASEGGFIEAASF